MDIDAVLWDLISSRVAPSRKLGQNFSTSITCPCCAASYDVPIERIQGKTLKCQRCGHQWQPAPDHGDGGARRDSLQPSTSEAASQEQGPDPSTAKLASIYPVPPVAPAAAEIKAAGQGALMPASTLLSRNAGYDSVGSPPIMPDPPQQTVRFGWATIFLVLSAVIWALYVFRDPIVMAWPASVRLYAAVGLI